MLELFVGLVLDLAADDHVLIREGARHLDVEGEVGEGALETYARGHVDVEHELLQALSDLLIGHVVVVDEGSAIGVDGAPRLCTRRLALRGERGVDQLTEEGTQVLCGTGFHLAADAAETVGEQLSHVPARAVGAEETEVVQMDVAALVSLAHLFGIDLIQPIFLGEVLADVVVEPVDALLHVGVLFDAPVLVGKIAGEELRGLADERGDLPRFLTTLAVKDVRLRSLCVTLVDEHLFHEVLNVLDGGDLVHELDFRSLHHQLGKLRRKLPVLAAASLCRLENGVRDLLLVEEFDPSVTLQNLDDHDLSPYVELW